MLSDFLPCCTSENPLPLVDAWHTRRLLVLLLIPLPMRKFSLQGVDFKHDANGNGGGLDSSTRRAHRCVLHAKGSHVKDCITAMVL